jgi:hypothetical protein
VQSDNTPKSKFTIFVHLYRQNRRKKTVYRLPFRNFQKSTYTQNSSYQRSVSEWF